MSKQFVVNSEFAPAGDQPTAIAGLVQGLSEAIAFGQQAGLDMHQVLDVIGKGAAQSWQLDNRGKTMADDKFEFGFAVDWMRKDLGLVMDEAKRNFYQYHASLIEPWDGPASLCFTNGDFVGATLDRNGLRPLRYAITNDNRVIVASEAGVLTVDEKTILRKGRLQPGKMFLIDLEHGQIITDEEIKHQIAGRQPYGRWLENYKIKLEELPEPRVSFTAMSKESVYRYQKVFGYSREDIETIIKPMALDGKEPVGSMGTDVPLAVLSDRPQHISSYFKQFFAQVTNPPIDPIRERLVMSLATFIGNNGNILDEDKMHCHCVTLKQPILIDNELEKLRSIDTGLFHAKTLQTYFKADGLSGSMQNGIDRLCRYAEDAVNDGFEVLILSDRAIDSEHAPIPSLLAVSAVHHYLIKKGLRGAVGLVVEAGDVWEVHHFACLLAFGATTLRGFRSFLFRKGTLPNVKTEIDLCGLKVGLPAGTTMANAIVGLSTNCTTAGKAAIAYSIYPDQATTVLAVRSGRAELTILSAHVSSWWQQNAGDELDIVLRPDQGADFNGMVVRKGGLANVMQKAVQQLMNDGTFKTIFAKWNIEKLMRAKAEINISTR